MDNSKLVATTGSSNCGLSHKTSSNAQNNISAKQPERTRPLQKLKLGAFRVSGKLCKAEEFRESLWTSSSKHVDYLLRNNMKATLESGSSFQVLGKLIRFNPL